MTTNASIIEMQTIISTSRYNVFFYKETSIFVDRKILYSFLGLNAFVKPFKNTEQKNQWERTHSELFEWL